MAMDSTADLSIVAIVPLYNGAKFIEEAIRSVLAQTLQPAEFLVVDDGSTDDGPAIVERIAKENPLIKLWRKSNGGQSSARNFGVARSKSALIALLDQDDVWYPHHLETLVKPFRRERAIPLGWVYSNLDEVDESGGMITRSLLNTMPAHHPKRTLIECLAMDMFILPSASLIAREAFEAVGGFDERLSGYEDDDLFLRLFRSGYDHVYIDQPLSKWRIYIGSTSYSPRMARSRMIYAEKLMATFPDNPALAIQTGPVVPYPMDVAPPSRDKCQAMGTSLRKPALVARAEAVITLGKLRLSDVRETFGAAH
jgi:glycosyltransferase involved in cell wall biosynthesis